MAKFKLFPNQGIADNIYRVDCVYGNDTTGDGSAENPFKTISKIRANPIANITIVIASGLYDEPDEWLNTGNNVKMYGEGTVIITDTTGINIKRFGANYYTENITFSNITSQIILNEVNSTSYTFKNCKFVNLLHLETASITQQFNPLIRKDFINCIFVNTTIRRAALYLIRYINCIFIDVFFFRASSTFSDTMINCYIGKECTASHYTPVQNQVLYDYNCFENQATKNLFTSATSTWSNLNSIIEVDPFNDFDKTSTFVNFMYQDYSLKPTSLCKNSGIGAGYAGYIGAQPVGYVIDAQTINSNLSVTNPPVNITYDAPSKEIRLTNGALEGFYETNAIAIAGGSTIKISLFDLKQLVGYGVDGEPVTKADRDLDAVPDTLINQKTTIDTDIIWGTDFATVDASTDWVNMEQNFDFITDTSGRGTGDSNFDITSLNPVLEVAYVKLRQTIRV